MSHEPISCLIPFFASSNTQWSVWVTAANKPARVEQKLKTLENYIAQYPTGWKKRLDRANLLYFKGDWLEAAAEYQHVIERQPQLLEARLRLGKMLQLMGHTDQAHTAYQQTIPLIRNEALKAHINGLSFLCMAHFYKAVTAFKQAIALEPEQIAHRLVLAQTYAAYEHHVETISAFAAVLAVQPDDINGLIGSYDTLLTVHAEYAAHPLLEHLHAIAPEDSRVLERLIRQRYRQLHIAGQEGRHTRHLIKKLLKQLPEAPQAGDIEAHYYLLRGEQVRGLAKLQKLVEHHSHHPYAWYAYGRALYQTGAYPAAAHALLQAHEYYPNVAEIYYTLCACLPAAGYEQKLRPLVEEMRQRFPYHWRAQLTTGQVLVAYFKDSEQGCALAAQGVQLQPQLPEAWQRYAQVLALAGRTNEAAAAKQKQQQLEKFIKTEVKSFYT